MDIIDEITRAHREVRDDGGGTRTVLLTRYYDAEPEDVWDACTSAERIGRWLLPVSGDLRLGGTYQLEGNAGGRILRCEPPRLLAVTWVYGVPPDAQDAPFSEVEVLLTPEGGGTRLELRHTAVVPEEMWERYGPGATGVGWDLAVLGLTLHLTTGDTPPEHEAMHETQEGRAFITASGRAWGEAFLAAGAPPERAEATTQATITFYAPPEE